MQWISTWLLSIVGVVLLSTLIDIILPEGTVRKFIHGIFALIIMLVVISPLPKLVGKEFNFDFGNGGGMGTDPDYIANVYKKKITVLEKNIQEALKQEDGLDGVVIKIYVDRYDENMQITTVLCNLSGVVLDSGGAHIDKYPAVTDKVVKLTGVKREKVVCSG